MIHGTHPSVSIDKKQNMTQSEGPLTFSRTGCQIYDATSQHHQHFCELPGKLTKFSQEKIGNVIQADIMLYIN